MNPFERERKKTNQFEIKNQLIYHSICGLGEPETSTVKTASVCNKASVSVGFFVIFGAAKKQNPNKKNDFKIISNYF
jgi:hypothetical protein